ncbi:MAG: dethiobiotin synthase [Bacteroidales bacterium]
MSHIFYISGIDTDCGKTYVTGLLARNFVRKKYSVITQKPIQTGCTKNIADDIFAHRDLMETELFTEDINNTTCPYIFSYPASPHFAAEIDKKEISFSVLTQTREILQNTYSILLIEGAGGLCVPITKDVLFIDYLAEQSYPLILVCSSQLGSINHSILSLELCKHKNIQVHTIVYNFLPDTDPDIAQNSFEYIKTYVSKHFPETELVTSVELEHGRTLSI